jgi:hypothetical protein
MTAEEYDDYVTRVKMFMEREGLDNLSPETDEESNQWKETCFSRHECQCCLRPLAGSRVTCNGYNPTTEEVQGGYQVCRDCVYFATYGKLDDDTMMDVEKDRNSREVDS